MAELLHGSEGHRPLSSDELTEWIALERLRIWEHEQEMRKSKRR